MSSDELVMVACPPYPEFKEAPPDQPHSELFDCPKCDGKMWLSGKKKGILLFSTCIGRDILLCCYHCMTKHAMDNKEDFLKAKNIRI